MSGHFRTLAMAFRSTWKAQMTQADGAWAWRWVYTVCIFSAPFQVMAFSILTHTITHTQTPLICVAYITYGICGDRNGHVGFQI